MEYIPKKKVRFNVQCPENHIFEKVFQLEPELMVLQVRSLDQAHKN